MAKADTEQPFTLGDIKPEEFAPGMFAMIRDGEERDCSGPFGHTHKHKYCSGLYGEVLRIRAFASGFALIEVLTGAQAGETYTVEVAALTFAYVDPAYKQAKLEVQAAAERKRERAVALVNRRWWQFWIR